MHSTKLASIRTTSLAFALGALVLGTSAVAAERTVSRAGLEYTPVRYERVEAVAAKDSAENSAATDAKAGAPTISRAGIEYTPPYFSGLKAWIQELDVPASSATSQARVEPPHANRAGIVKWVPRYDSFAEFRDRLANRTN